MVEQIQLLILKGALGLLSALVCRWAAGATNEDAAASAVTAGINGCGKFRYGSGESKFTGRNWMNPWVNLTSCIGRLSHAGQVRFDVNCEDCASFVVSFANAVGCHLWASSMGLDFKLSPIVPIGYENAVVGVEFNFHEVAWDGACGDADFVYDAALRYDGDDNPGVFPIVPVISVRIEFCDGVIGAPFDYRERLTLPGPEGYGNCRARHSEKVRRLLR